jgi:hypothetical protein
MHGQMKMDELNNLDVLHQADFEYYHDSECDGRVTLRSEKNIEQLSSHCPVCGLLVTSSKQATYVSKMRNDGS